MPERVYMNRIPGEERIHVEIRAEEIPGILKDLALGVDSSPEALELWRLLKKAQRDLGA